MDPMTLGLLLSYGPSLLATLGGAGREEEDYYRRLRAAQDPSNIGRFTGMAQTRLNQSMAPARAGILSGANDFQNSLLRAFGRSGMGDTGIGALAATAASSKGAGDLSRLQMLIGSQANQQGREDYQNNISNVMSRGPAPNRFQTALGVGTDAFRQYLMARWNQQKPTIQQPTQQTQTAPSPVLSPTGFLGVQKQFPDYFGFSLRPKNRWMF